MNIAFDSWRIDIDTSVWVFAILSILIAAYLGIWTWLRMKKKAKIALWESFRFFNYSPDYLPLFNRASEKLNQEQKSQIVCLQDVSDNVETKDVITSEGDPIKRSTWTRQFLKGEWIKNLKITRLF